MTSTGPEVLLCFRTGKHIITHLILAPQGCVTVLTVSLCHCVTVSLLTVSLLLCPGRARRF